jgi:signal transduction histidine kinase
MLLGGELEIHSRRGGGTTLVARVPVGHAGAAAKTA